MSANIAVLLQWRIEPDRTARYFPDGVETSSLAVKLPPKFHGAIPMGKVRLILILHAGNRPILRKSPLNINDLATDQQPLKFGTIAFQGWFACGKIQDVQFESVPSCERLSLCPRSYILCVPPDAPFFKSRQIPKTETEQQNTRAQYRETSRSLRLHGGYYKSHRGYRWVPARKISKPMTMVCNIGAFFSRFHSIRFRISLFTPSRNTV
jgi:hypothetical protein